jgi:hypothetical protein
MKILARRAALGILSIAAVGAVSIAAFSAVDQVRTQAQVQTLIAQWPPASRLAAGTMLEKYGAPDSATSNGLIWRRRGNWTRIEVYRDEHPAKRNGILESVVRCTVPVASWADLNALELGVSYEPIGEMLSSASESEADNILALNVAFDVIKGRRSVPDARKFYLKTTGLAMSGKSSLYMQGLRFEPARGENSVQAGQILPWPYTRGFKFEPAEGSPPVQPVQTWPAP